jgi:K(+)-stimulated pyrophosphate-energized sodium pump
MNILIKVDLFGGLVIAPILRNGSHTLSDTACCISAAQWNSKSKERIV